VHKPTPAWLESLADYVMTAASYRPQRANRTLGDPSRRPTWAPEIGPCAALVFQSMEGGTRWKKSSGGAFRPTSTSTQKFYIRWHTLQTCLEYRTPAPDAPASHHLPLLEVVTYTDSRGVAKDLGRQSDGGQAW